MVTSRRKGNNANAGINQVTATIKSQSEVVVIKATQLNGFGKVNGNSINGVGDGIRADINDVGDSGAARGIDNGIGCISRRCIVNKMQNIFIGGTTCFREGSVGCPEVI